MHKELESFFEEHANPTHGKTADVHALAAPILLAISTMRKQMLEYESRLHQAELAPHDHALDANVEMMHQTIGHAKTALDELTQKFRGVTRDFVQFDRYIGDWQETIANYERSKAQGPS